LSRSGGLGAKRGGRLGCVRQGGDNRRRYSLCGHIEPKIEFFFHWCVCLFELFKTATLRNPRAPAVGAALLLLNKASSPRENLNGKHTLLFNPMFARSSRARSHKVWAYYETVLEWLVF